MTTKFTFTVGQDTEVATILWLSSTFRSFTFSTNPHWKTT